MQQVAVATHCSIALQQLTEATHCSELLQRDAAVCCCSAEQWCVAAVCSSALNLSEYGSRRQCVAAVCCSHLNLSEYASRRLSTPLSTYRPRRQIRCTAASQTNEVYHDSSGQEMRCLVTGLTNEVCVWCACVCDSSHK